MKAGIIHRVQTFDGRHEWPPISVATAAIQWMQLQAIKTGKRSRDEGFINATWEQLLNQARTLEQANQYVEAYELYLDLATSFKGLRDVAEIETKVNQLRNSSELKTAIREEQAQIKKQRELEARINTLIAGRNSAASANDSDESFVSGNLLPKILNDLRKQSKASEELQSAQSRSSRVGWFIRRPD